MRQNLAFVIAMLLGIQISAQVIYVSTSNYDVYTLDLNDCSLEFVVNINSSYDIFDISFHPNGNLYGIAPFGHMSLPPIITLYRLTLITHLIVVLRLMITLMVISSELFLLQMTVVT